MMTLINLFIIIFIYTINSIITKSIFDKFLIQLFVNFILATVCNIYRIP